MAPALYSNPTIVGNGSDHAFPDTGQHGRGTHMTKAPRATWAFLVGALALALAILPTYVLPITHPELPVASRVGETVSGIKERLVALAQGRVYEAPATPGGERARWARYASLAAASSGLMAILLAAWAYGRDEPVKACSAALALGIAAVVCSNLIGVATGLLALLYRSLNPLG